MDTGQTVALHKDLFVKKLSILAADSGQLISINDAIFKASNSTFFTKTVSRWLAIFVVLFLVGGAIIFALTQVDINSSIPENTLERETFVTMTTEEGVALPEASTESLEQRASTQDILAALNGEIIEEVVVAAEQVAPTLPATANDILGAIHTEEQVVGIETKEALLEQSEEPTLTTNDKEESPLEQISLAQAGNQAIPETKVASNGQYYQAYQDGYVIQLGNYSQLAAVENMIKASSGTELHYYARIRNGINNWVLTSKVFLSRKEADEAKQILVEQNPTGSFWTRSLASVHADIEKHAISAMESQ